jgi:hypothetical protein
VGNKRLGSFLFQYFITFAVPFTTQAGMVARCDWKSADWLSTESEFLSCKNIEK